VNKTSDPTLFFRAFDELRRKARAGDKHDADELLAALCSLVRADTNLKRASGRMSLLAEVMQRYGLTAPADTPQRSTVNELDNYVHDVRDGVSIVTCCMNRNENLVRALRSWLALRMVDEVVILDWSSARPVEDSITAAGLTDDRVTVARIDNERRWILTVAFNAAFRLSRFSRILKLDADLMVEPHFFERNRLRWGTFVAGDWRKARAGQEYINGIVYVHRDDLFAVNGFNEFIKSYGWDDSDLYSRLDARRLRRLSVDPATVRHLDHTDAERLGPPVAHTALHALLHDPSVAIKRNRFIANVLPRWGRALPMSPFLVKADGARLRLVRLGTPQESEAPAWIMEDANYYVVLEWLSRRYGLEPVLIDKVRLLELLAHHSLADLDERFGRRLAEPRDSGVPEVLALQ